MKKVFMAAIALVLIVIISVSGSFAYLTDTGKVENTFSVGKVEITLDEAETDEYGVAVSLAARVPREGKTGNSYKLLPGHTYIKDPTIHVQPGSEACWLFVKVENGISAIEAGTTIAAQITANGWAEHVSGVYFKQAPANTGTDAVDYKVFENFKIKTDADVSAYGTAKIIVTAYAIQKDGVANAAAAWNALTATP